MSPTGTTTFLVEPTKKALAFLDNPLVPHTFKKEKASTLTEEIL